MHNVNCWLLALAFLLGLVITLAFLLRRVKREVPEYGSGSGAARLTGSSADVKAPKADLPDVDAPTAKVPKISGGGAVAAGAAGVAGGAAAAKLAGSGGDVDTPTAKVPKVDAPDVDAPTAKVPKISGGGAVAAGAAGVAAGAAAAKLVGSGGDSGKDSEPYGAGSLRLAAGAAAPSGWTIKGNEDSMLYHTTDSPSYKQTIAEVWFRDEPTAERAGFTRWDKGRGAGGGGGIAALADVPAGKFGAGSATPGAGGSGPQGWTIKGNEDSMLYHTTESPSYKRTIAEVWFFDEDTARKAGFTHWKEGRKATGAANFAATEPEVPPGKFGPGSTTPAADGSGPAGWTVKGNEDSMLYHSPESPAYAVTIAEIWFRDVPTAEAAGFNRWDSGKSQRGK